VELRTYFIDGARFTTLEEFYDEVERELLDGSSWGRNLDAFDDILRGGFGPLPAEFGLVWLNATLSQARLDYAETARQLRRRLERCHASVRESVELDLAAAEAGRGATVFDWIIGIVQEHPNVRFELAN